MKTSVCKKCGATMLRTLKYCPSCGGDVVANEIALSMNFGISGATNRAEKKSIASKIFRAIQAFVLSNVVRVVVALSSAIVAIAKFLEYLHEKKIL